MKLKFKNVLVYGLSISGESVAVLLKKKKCNVFLYDDDSFKLKAKAIKGCYVLQKLNAQIISQFDFIVVSPSIEKDNEYLILARQEDIPIYSEVEFASNFCKDFLAITGTNGKTTTVELVTAILNKKKKAIACGNIGYPLSRAVLNNKKAIKVVEVSSFMLENCTNFKPHLATILNVSPDHLIRHKTMEEYTNLKLKIFKNQSNLDFCVVNLDENLKIDSQATKITYSYKKLADVYVKGGYVYLHEHRLFAINELNLKGKHNVYNVMCAVACAYAYKVKPKRIRKAVLNYHPKRFRIEYINSVNGINFYNDSKSTNISSTLASVETIKGNIILLLGGSNKVLDYREMFLKLPKRIKNIVVYGEIADNFINANDGIFNIQKADTLQNAFNLAISSAKKNDNILLSPATASYDQYTSFIERGEDFNRLVEEYANKKE